VKRMYRLPDIDFPIYAVGHFVDDSVDHALIVKYRNVKVK
jgi:hypothetical protein